MTSERLNAVVAWAMTTAMVAGAIESLVTNAPLWGSFVLFVVAVSSLPAVASRDWLAVVPWPLLAVAALAVVARALELHAEAAGYLAIAMLALVIVVELDVFTPVELSHRFAVVFAVLTTMALEALWVIAQFYSDVWLGTRFLTSQTELQEDIVLVTVVGSAVGALFYWYFARFGYAGAGGDASDLGGPP